MTKKLYLYPLWIRLWHLANAVLFLLLIITGISMQYGLDYKYVLNFKSAVNIHNVCGVLISVLYLVFLTGNIFSSNKKHYKIEYKGLFIRLKKQFLYYSFRMFKNEKPPFPLTTHQKFNPLQQFTYVLTMYIGMPLIIITGFALMFPEIIIDTAFKKNGVIITDVLHIVIGFLLSVFLIIHFYFSTISHKPKGNFKAIIKGYHETE
ncbi:MAG: cytochrome b/b6 domain-containing protein [Bacteroidales bacterium]|nr:cytochrome b/b6 domain-containing protein [Bacteroidales bacterium]